MAATAGRSPCCARPTAADVGAVAHPCRTARARLPAPPTCSVRSARGRAAASRLSSRRRCPNCPPCCSAPRWRAIASSLNYLLNRDAIIDLLNAEKATILVLPHANSTRLAGPRREGVLEQVPTLQHVLVIGGAAIAGRIPAGSRPCSQDSPRRCARLRAIDRSQHGVRAVPHRRNYRAAQAGAAHAWQPDPRRLRLWAGLRLQRDATSPSTASPSSMSAGR